MYRYVDAFETIFISSYIIDVYPFTFKDNKLDEYLALSKLYDEYRNTYRTNKQLQIQFLIQRAENNIHTHNTQ